MTSSRSLVLYLRGMAVCMLAVLLYVMPFQQAIALGSNLSHHTKMIIFRDM
jgi:hypothetical protein